MSEAEGARRPLFEFSALISGRQKVRTPKKKENGFRFCISLVFWVFFSIRRAAAHLPFVGATVSANVSFHNNQVVLFFYFLRLPTFFFSLSFSSPSFLRCLPLAVLGSSFAFFFPIRSPPPPPKSSFFSDD